LVKVAAGALVIFTVAAAAYSFYDGYQWTARYQIHIPIEEATNFAASRLNQNESIGVLCASNSFSEDMVRFYLEANTSIRNNVWQYPERAVDAFKPDFNVSELISLCENRTAKYVFLYEYGATFPYFDSTLTMHEVYGMLLDSGRFTYVNMFGESPRTISILAFT
jgi:hypothetical protein